MTATSSARPHADTEADPAGPSGDPRPPREVSGRTFVTVAIVVVVALASFIGGTVIGWKRVTVPPALTEVDGRIALSYQQLRNDPDLVNEQLKLLEVDVAVREVPASPDRVGDVVWSQRAAPPATGLVTLDAAPWLVTECRSGPCDRWDGSPPGIELFVAGILIPVDGSGLIDSSLGTMVLVGRAGDVGEVPILE